MDFKSVLFIFDITWVSAFILYVIAYFFGVRSVYVWTNDPDAGFWKYYAYLSFIFIGLISGVVVAITLFESPDTTDPAVYFGLGFQVLVGFIGVAAFTFINFIKICNWLGNAHDRIIKKRGL